MVSVSSVSEVSGWNRVVNIAILVTLALVLLNPSGVVGTRIIAGYKEWQEQRRIALNWDELVSAPSRLGLPPAIGRSIIVEFMDYDCPACQTVAPAVLEATRNLEVTVVVRHVPSARGGPGAREAALAAICAEQYDLFPEAHDALLSDQTWLRTRDWVGFGLSLGVGDSKSFGNCLGEEATQLRVARDMALADALRIPGTPTFVSAQELHPGTDGLVSALAAMSQAAPAQDPASLRPATESLFDSSEHPTLSDMLRRVSAGFFLPDNGVALVDPTAIHIVDLSSRETRTVGREGEGPEEFGHITGAVRAPQGIAVWDIYRQRVTFIARDGEFLHSQGYLDVPFKGFMNVRPVAAQPDGSIVFRDGVRLGSSEYQGRIRLQVQFVSVRHDGGLQVVAEALGDEEYYGNKMSDGVIFGHRTLEAATRDHFIVADTDRGDIAVRDWSGEEVASIPMSAGVRLSADHMRIARESEAEKWQRTKESVMEQARAGRIPYPTSPEARANFPTLPPDWPINEVAPRIDAMLADFDERLWVRDYRLPGQDSVTWRVWDIDEARLLFTATMDGEDTLLDARSDLVLLRRFDELDVPQSVVIRLRTASE